eukprot:Clim_evm185s157 gene=Clim_evmTU185s157
MTASIQKRNVSFAEWPPKDRFAFLESFKEGWMRQGMIPLDNRLFGIHVRGDIIHSMVKWQLAMSRPVIAHTKKLPEIKGSTRKPWPQKGTGRARHGYTRGPIWRGGEKKFGPRNERKWTYDLNLQVQQIAVRMTLSLKYNQGLLHIIDDFDLGPEATQDDYGSRLINRGFTKVAVVMGGDTPPEHVIEATEPLDKWLTVMSSPEFSVYDVMRRHTLILTKGALEDLTNKYEKPFYHKSKANAIKQLVETPVAIKDGDSIKTISVKTTT